MLLMTHFLIRIYEKTNPKIAFQLFIRSIYWQIYWLYNRALGQPIGVTFFYHAKHSQFMGTYCEEDFSE
jgi:hypothetical protein